MPTKVPDVSAGDLPRTGTQAISRAVMVLKEVSTRGKFGWRMSDLADRCGLDRATTHRILSCLVRERMITQRDEDRHYLPGPLLYEMGLAVPRYVGFQNACAPVLRRLVKRFGGFSLAHVRSDTESICVARAGASVYVGNPMDVGSRWPLCASAGGVAMLIELPPEERQRIWEQNLTQLRGRGRGAIGALKAMIRQSETLGFAFNRGQTATGVVAVACPVFDGRNCVFGSLVLVGLDQNVSESSVLELVKAVRREAEVLMNGMAQAS
ncbi:IclR family transcriptional regulator [Candidimonas nitroreducens]|uniref:Transcriptional regulator n=1 Tax=Candidimonas nitroreducens TaxID=683354 RepID=A0A225MZ03_9BURK|nr:IclR family transcriptional regulator [Candidimonas nitroreducens]OWT63919.1 transcriptional regulator [Candidimonas nitroreducens]